jgi:hypothetical protein
MPGIDSSLLHIVNGDLAAGTFLHTFGASDRLLIHRDVLTCGPLPRLMKAAAWQKARADFWGGTLGFLRSFDLDPSPIDLLKNVERLKGDGLPCVWAGTGNSDQLLICLVMHLVTTQGRDAADVRVVQFETDASTGQRVRNTGSLSREGMRAHPEPRKLSLFERAACRDAWLAVTASDPGTIESFASRHPDAPVYLKDAVRKTLRRYPDRRSGLPYWDRVLLANVRDRGPKSSAILAATIDAMYEDGDLVGDLHTFSRLVRMAAPAAARPLLDLQGNRQHIGQCQVTLTEFGARVLAGQDSFWPANTIDEWAGGVHLSSVSGRLWFEDEGRLTRG